MKRFLAGLVLAGLASTLPASARADTRIYVRIGPPAAIVETRPVAPGPRYVWVTGYHRWNGTAYVWVPGRWRLPPSHYSVWVAGHWAHHPHNGYYWVGGHWR